MHLIEIYYLLPLEQSNVQVLKQEVFSESEQRNISFSSLHMLYPEKSYYLKLINNIKDMYYDLDLKNIKSSSSDEREEFVTANMGL